MARIPAPGRASRGIVRRTGPGGKALGGSSMYHTTGLVGIDIVMAGIQKQLERMQYQSIAGMVDAVSFIREDMEKTSPKVPVDTGNLRASWAQDVQVGLNGNPGAIFGFTANYARRVHEMVGKGGKDINWSRPGSGSKFFQSAIRRNSTKITAMIGRRMR